MSNETDERGYFKLLNPSLVHFHFEGVDGFEVDGLNHQNVLGCLKFSCASNVDESALRVDMEHCYGLSGSFTARRARIVSVRPHPDRVP